MQGGAVAVLTSAWRALDRWRWIVRYHRPAQLARRLYRNLTSPGRLGPSPSYASGVQEALGRAPAGMSLDDLANGRITLINLTRDLGRPIDWRLQSWPAAPLLWAFHLHYHEFFCHTVAGAGEASAGWPIVWQTIADWLAAMDAGTLRSRIAWHPYCISRRLAAWTRLLRLQEPPPALADAMRHSIARQADFLARHLERDLGGNHLWENARGLVAAGVALGGPSADRWRNVGSTLLRQCIAEQILPHGEHIERSPMYQIDLAAGLVELADWLQPIDAAAAEYLRDAGWRMTTFVDALRHPDGSIPLFGDTTLDFDSPRPQAPDFSGRIGEYFVDRTGGDLVLFDAGDLCPNHLPAHAHADLLGIEMSVAGQRLLVDSGVYSYSGPVRGRYRGSASHNVLTIDGVELADAWGDFRMGRRGRVIDRAAGTVAGGRWRRAAHDAYRSLGVPRVVRVWFIAGDRGPYFSAHVALTGRTRGEHELAEYLHWSPEAAVALDGGNAHVTIPGREIVWEPATAGIAIHCASGGYSPYFYCEQPITVLELRQTSLLPAVSAWALSPTGAPVQPTAALDGNSLMLSWSSGGSQQRVAIPLQ